MFDRFRRPAEPPAAHTTNPTHHGGVPATTTSSTSSTQPVVNPSGSRFSEASDLEAGTTRSRHHGNVAGNGPMDEKVEDAMVGWEDPYGPAPGFKKWWKIYWHDVAAFIFLAAIALWLLLWSPVPYKKYFTITTPPSESYTTYQGAHVISPSFANPKRSQFVPIIPDAMIAVFAPIVSIVITNFLGIGTFSSPGRRLTRLARRGTFLFGRGSFWNVNNGCMGVIYSVMTGATIQIIVKLAVPGLRPHFLTVCDPVLPLPPGEGFGGLYYTSSICRDHENRKSEIANAMQSFPSGHSVAAWAGLFYLSLYFNAHFKIFANYHPSYWKLLLFVAPLVAATLIVGSLSMDMSHHWYDIVTGSLIGVAMAILSYRMVFASVWDFRWNHVPLIRGIELPAVGYGEGEMQQWTGGVATRQGGWGVGRSAKLGGAPGDVKYGVDVGGASAAATGRHMVV